MDKARDKNVRLTAERIKGSPGKGARYGRMNGRRKGEGIAEGMERKKWQKFGRGVGRKRNAEGIANGRRRG